jgi:hypothetical protein
MPFKVDFANPVVDLAVDVITSPLPWVAEVISLISLYVWMT